MPKTKVRISAEHIFAHKKRICFKTWTESVLWQINIYM